MGKHQQSKRLRHHKKSCRRKVRLTQTEAIKQGQRRGLAYYRCRTCGWWHHTKAQA